MPRARKKRERGSRKDRPTLLMSRDGRRMHVVKRLRQELKVPLVSAARILLVQQLQGALGVEAGAEGQLKAERQRLQTATFKGA